MSNPAEDVIVRNLIETVDRLQENLDRVELWSVVLDCFQSPSPDYERSNRYILPPSRQAEMRRAETRSF